MENTWSRKVDFQRQVHSVFLTMSAYVWREREDGEYIPVPITKLTEKVSNKDLPHSLQESPMKMACLYMKR